MRAFPYGCVLRRAIPYGYITAQFINFMCAQAQFPIWYVLTTEVLIGCVLSRPGPYKTHVYVTCPSAWQASLGFGLS